MEIPNITRGLEIGLFLGASWALWKIFLASQYDWRKAWQEEQKEIWVKSEDGKLLISPGWPEEWKQAWRHAGGQTVEYF